MIQFDGIEVTYGDFTALPDFNLTVQDGEFFTLLGPSGCAHWLVLSSLVREKSGRTTATYLNYTAPNAGSAWCFKTMRCSPQ